MDRSVCDVVRRLLERRQHGPRRNAGRFGRSELHRIDRRNQQRRRRDRRRSGHVDRRRIFDGRWLTGRWLTRRRWLVGSRRQARWRRGFGSRGRSGQTDRHGPGRWIRRTGGRLGERDTRRREPRTKLQRRRQLRRPRRLGRSGSSERFLRLHLPAGRLAIHRLRQNLETNQPRRQLGQALGRSDRSEYRARSEHRLPRFTPESATRSASSSLWTSA